MAEARGGGGGVLKYKSGMCHGWFKNRGPRERPLTENGGGGAFGTGPHVKKKRFWS